MLKKSASGVLASLRVSTYRDEPLGYRNHWRGFSVRQNPLQGRTVHTKCGTYLLASSLAAALLDRLFEHPEVILASVQYGKFSHIFGINRVFPQPAKWRARPSSGLSKRRIVEYGRSLREECELGYV